MTVNLIHCMLQSPKQKYWKMGVFPTATSYLLFFFFLLLFINNTDQLGYLLTLECYYKSNTLEILILN